MLVLSRKETQSLVIGNDVIITIVAINGNRVTIGIEAPDSVKILRSELLNGNSASVNEYRQGNAPLLDLRPGEIGQNEISANRPGTVDNLNR